MEPKFKVGDLVRFEPGWGMEGAYQVTEVKQTTRGMWVYVVACEAGALMVLGHRLREA